MADEDYFSVFSSELGSASSGSIMNDNNKMASLEKAKEIDAKTR